MKQSKPYFSCLTRYLLLSIVLLAAGANSVFAQTALGLKETLQLAVQNYGLVKAKSNYVKSAERAEVQAKLDYLPNLNLSAQVDYGTANGQNGPAYAFGPVGIASAGLPLGVQNWNAAFGALYLANFNWDFFAFGRSREKVKIAGARRGLDESDLNQEIFQLKVKVAGAYLNLLAAQRLTESYKKNLYRADTLRSVIVRRVQHDLAAGVDSSQASAEVSNAKSTLLKAMTYENEQNNNLIRLLGIDPRHIDADTLFIAGLPRSILTNDDTLLSSHPTLEYFRRRVRLSDQQADYFRTFNYPTLTLGAALQARGSGFNYSYTTAQPNYNSDFSQGVNPDRANYIIALGITWNFTQPFRTRQQVLSQQLISKGLDDELELTRQQLLSQINLSDSTIKNAVADYYESPIQLKAANDAYQQKLVLYNHGLTNLVDVTQALYVLVRAETDRDIAYANVWQALLLKAAATGNFDIFYNNL